MKIISEGNTFHIYSDHMQAWDSLPPATYSVAFDRNKGFYLTLSEPVEVREVIIYGNLLEKVNKVSSAFSRMNRSMGVMLSGDKGSGKSLFAKLLAESMMKQGFPVIRIDSYLPGIAAYLESITQQVVVLFDEFDKTFGKDSDQEHADSELLTLFDGVSGGKKLYVVTCNDHRKISPYFLNRPGRFHYHFRFDAPSSRDVEAYLRNELQEKYHHEIPAVVDFARKIRLSYDCLRAIAFELNGGASFRDAVSDLNIVQEDDFSYIMTVTLNNGMTSAPDDIDGNMMISKKRVSWLDFNGNGRLCVCYNLRDCVWNDRDGCYMINPDKLKLDYEEGCEDDEFVKQAMQSGIASCHVTCNPPDSIKYTL